MSVLCHRKRFQSYASRWKKDVVNGTSLVILKLRSTTSFINLGTGFFCLFYHFFVLSLLADPLELFLKVVFFLNDT